MKKTEQAQVRVPQIMRCVLSRNSIPSQFKALLDVVSRSGVFPEEFTVIIRLHFSLSID
jgi:hypothetical protein